MRPDTPLIIAIIAGGIASVALVVLVLDLAAHLTC